jgi:hypothetical protein
MVPSRSTPETGTPPAGTSGSAGPVRRPLHATKRLPLLFSCSPSSQSSPRPHTTVFAADADSFNGMNFTDVLIVRDLKLGFVFFLCLVYLFYFSSFPSAAASNKLANKKNEKMKKLVQIKTGHCLV